MALEDRGGSPVAGGPSVATTAYVDAADALKAPLDSPHFTTAAWAPTPVSTDNGTYVATTAFVQAQKVSPAFTGTPTATTPSTFDNSTKIATTAFVYSTTANQYNATTNSGTRQYQRIATLNGQSATSGADVTVLVSGYGDYGQAKRGTAIVQLTQRGTNPSGLTGRVNWLTGWDNATFYYVSTGSYTAELWALNANYQFTPTVTILDAQAATITMDLVSTTAPANLVALPVVADLEFISNDYASTTSPAFTGTPTATTATSTDNSTRIATTAFVNANTASDAPLASPAFSGTPTAPTAGTSTNTTQIATTAFVKNQSYAPLANPGFSGTATAPTYKATSLVSTPSLQVDNIDGDASGVVSSNTIRGTVQGNASSNPGNAAGTGAVGSTIGFVAMDTTGRMGILTGSPRFPQAYSDVITTRAVSVGSTGQLGTASSARRTKNVHGERDFDDTQLEAWLSFPTVDFDYKADDEHKPHVGVIAEDVLEADPAFKTLIYFDETLDDPESKIDGFAYERMAVWNRMAIKRLLARVKDLESRIPA